MIKKGGDDNKMPGIKMEEKGEVDGKSEAKQPAIG